MDGDKVQLNDFGLIVKTEWLRSSEIRKELSPDIFIVMPNHFHGIVIIKHDGNPGRGVWPYAPTLHGTLHLQLVHLSRVSNRPLHIKLTKFVIHTAHPSGNEII